MHCPPSTPIGVIAWRCPARRVLACRTAQALAQPRRRGPVRAGPAASGRASTAAATVVHVSRVIDVRSCHVAIYGGEATPSPTQLSGETRATAQGCPLEAEQGFSMVDNCDATPSSRPRGWHGATDMTAQVPHKSL
jgi:hypothetical protein